MTHDRMSLIIGVPGIPHRRGHVPGDDDDTAWATLLISDLARIYEGALNHPLGPCINEMPPPQTEPAPPEPGGHDAIIVTVGQVKTLLAALDIAADYQRDRAQTCAYCTGQSCRTCQSRLYDAQGHDHLAAELIHAAETSAAATASRRGPTSQPQPGGNREVGQ